MNTSDKISKICDDVKSLLLEKNKKYGDSAINPIRIMSRSSPVEQILVRIDDKLNRITQGSQLVGEDEDVITDLIGYFVLLKIALDNQTEPDYSGSVLLDDDSLNSYDSQFWNSFNSKELFNYQSVTTD